MANKKKAFATTTAAVMAASAVAPVAAFAAEQIFPDVPSDKYYAEAVNYLAEREIINGTPEGTFNPTANITRDQAAKIIVLAAGLEGSAELSFKDNDAIKSWAVPYVKTAVANKVIEGNDKGYFNPEGNLTRAQAAKIIVEAFGLEGTNELSFKDNDAIKSWAVPYVKTAVANGIITGSPDGNFNPEANIERGDFALMVKRAIDKVAENEAPVEQELAVESVSAINGAQLEVKFTQAINADDVITENAGSPTKYYLNTGVFSVNGTTLAPSTYPATLSEDGKTLTIYATTNWDGFYTFELAEGVVKSLEGELVPEAKFTIDTEDKTAPVVTGITKLSHSTYRVQFSEPLSNAGTLTAKFKSDGSVATVSTSDSLVNGYIDVTITDPNADPGTVISLSLLGALDYSGNVISPNPYTFEITKGEKDGVAPTVESITPLALDRFEIKFSEEVNITLGDIKVNGVALSAPDTLVKDSKDKTKYTVTLNSALTAGIHSVSVSKNVTDLSGEVLSKTSDYQKAVQFSEDTTAPKLVASTVKKGVDGKEYLHLEFDEAVTVTGISDAAATAVKNNVTTTATFEATPTVVPNTGDKEWTIELGASATKFDSKALVEGTTYKFKLSTVNDKSSNTNAIKPVDITFTRGTDTAANVQSVSSIIQGSVPGQILVNFDHEVDAATATNVANYTVQGATVEKAEVFSTNLKQVVLTVKDDTITQSGNRNVTVRNVKTSSGKSMTKPYTVAVDLDENVAPTFEVSIISGDILKLTFSENVKGIEDLDDFEFYLDGTKLSEEGTAGTSTGEDVIGIFKEEGLSTLVGAADEVNVVYVALKTGTITDLSKVIKVEVEGTSVVDTVGNKLTGSATTK